MRKLIALAVAVPTLGFALACSGLPSGNDNVTPCVAYVDHFNDLKCMPDSAELKKADFCPAALDMNPNDMTPFYECLTKNAKCKGKQPDLGGQANCKM